MRSPVEAAVPAAKISHATRVPLQVTRDRFVRSHLDAAIPARKVPSQRAPVCPARIPIFDGSSHRAASDDETREIEIGVHWTRISAETVASKKRSTAQS